MPAGLSLDPPTPTAITQAIPLASAQSQPTALAITPVIGVGARLQPALRDRHRFSQALPARSRRLALPQAARAAAGMGPAPLLNVEPASLDQRPSAAELEQQLLCCQQELERHPTSAQAHLQMGRCLLLHNRLEAAIECLRRCLYLSPDCREAMLLWIQISQQCGQLQRSRQLQARLARVSGLSG